MNNKVVAQNGIFGKCGKATSDFWVGVELALL